MGPRTAPVAAASLRGGRLRLSAAGREDDASWRSGRRGVMEQTEPRHAVGVLTVAGKEFRPPQVSWSEKEAVPLCPDRREWFCDFRDHRRSSGLSFCHLRPCCHRVPPPLPSPVFLLAIVTWGVRIRFAYAACSCFCFRESKPSRVLIAGDFGQSKRSSVDTLGLSFACRGRGAFRKL
ncbi:uncharacterized protein DS421_20g693600 [Arachis hypogaea]|nr:uncharacterized protein DS421_20g693600 [Arachis hypogaea]